MDISCFFESRRIKGGPVVECKKTSDSTALVTFEDESVAMRMVASGMLNFNGEMITVSWPTGSAGTGGMSSGSGEAGQTPPDPRVIVVEGVKPALLSTLELHLESARNGGGEIDKSSQDDDSGDVTVTFVDADVAASFLKRETITVNGEKFRVSAPQPSGGGCSQSSRRQTDGSSAQGDTNTIEVRGVPDGLSEEMIRLYFENGKRSGGGTIKHFEFSPEEQRATITFESSKVVMNILSKDSHELNKTLVQVIALENIPEELLSQACAVEVTGISKSTSLDFISLYFENKKKSGGGKLDGEILYNNDGRAVITFTKHTVAKNVLKKKPHVLDNATVSVTSLKAAPPPKLIVGDVDPTKLLMTSLPENFDDKSLQEFLKKAAGCPITRVTRGRVPDLALIDFGGIPRYQEVRKLVVTKPYMGQMISVQKVKPSSSIRVEGIGQTTEENISLYFENKRSGGGEVKKVTIESDENCAIVEFIDRKVITEVLNRKHAIGDQRLTVTLHSEALAGDPSSRPRIPKDVALPYRPDIIRFVSKSSQLKAELEEQLQTVGQCCIDWSQAADGILLLSCTVKPTDKALGKLLRDWEKNCKSIIQTTLNKILTGEESVPEDIWKELLTAASDKKYSANELSVEVDSARHTIRLLGIAECVRAYQENLQQLSDQLLTALARRRNRTREVVSSLKPWQYRVLKALQFGQGLPQDLSLKIDDRQIAIEGSVDDVGAAKMEMFKFLNDVQQECASLQPFQLKLLQIQNTKERIDRCFKQNNLRVAWFVDGKEVKLYGMHARELQTACQAINDDLVCKKIPIEKSQIQTVKTSKWTQFRDSLFTQHPILDVNIAEDESGLCISATQDAITQVYDVVFDFLQQNTILEQLVAMAEGRVMYIDTYLQTELNDFLNKLQSQGVKIKLALKTAKTGLMVSGARQGLEAAVRQIEDMARRVVEYEHDSEVHGIHKVCSTKRGKDFIEIIQQRHKVIILCVELADGVNGADGGAKSQAVSVPVKTGPMLKCEVDVREGLVIKVVKGNIAEYSGVTAIAVSTNEELKLADGAAKLIADAGGQEFEESLRGHIKQSGKVLTGQIHAAKPTGVLHCSAVIFMVTPVWTGSGDTKKKKVPTDEALWKVIEKANKHRYKSLAIAGIAGAPAAVTARLTLEVLKEFTEQNKKMDVNEFCLIDVSDQVVNHWHDAAEMIFGKDKVKLAGRANERAVSGPVPVGTTDLNSTVAARHIQSLVTTYRSVNPDSVVTPEGVTVTLIRGAIVKQNVDVILNTASKELILNQGAVSNSILLAAGSAMQADCAARAPGGIKFGAVFISSNFNIATCKAVYHGTCMEWDNGAGPCIQTVRDLMSIALTTAHNSKMASIAFPAIGTGQLRIPRELASQTMYEEVEKFSKNNPGSTLKDVRFVVYDQDKPTVAAFEAHILRLTTTGSAMATMTPDKRRSKNRTLRQECSPQVQKSGDEAKAATNTNMSVSGRKCRGVKIGTVVMEVGHGDITKEDTDAIVNSTNSTLNLVGGAVSQAILRAGGPSIKQECDRLGHTTKGIAVTTAGNLPCKLIIHMATPDQKSTDKTTSPDAWEKCIHRCLEEAEKQRLQSIAFPLVGTGKWSEAAASVTTNLMAGAILNAVSEFSLKEKPSYLKLVRVTIFDNAVVDVFVQEITKKIEEKKAQGGTWDGVKRFLGYRTAEDDIVLLDSTAEQQEAVTMKRVFRIYGPSQQTIDAVVKDIDDLGKDSLADKVLDSAEQQEQIAKLTPDQINRIEAVAARYHVKPTVEQGRRVNRIRLQGDAMDITTVMEQVLTILHELAQAEHRKTEAELIAQQAHWEFLDEDDTWDSYPAEINAIIEKAFLAKQPFVEWIESSDEKFKVDFSTSTELCSGKPQGTKVKRICDVPIEHPKTWDPMDPTENLLVVPLVMGCKEFTDVEKAVRLTCESTVKEILKIERIQNKTQYQQYAVKKLYMDAASGGKYVVERILWHGTGIQTVQQINTNGFNRSYCGKNAVVYGQGVYFAKNWVYSAQNIYSIPEPDGTKRIYQVRVLTGEITVPIPPPNKPVSEMIDVPLKPNSTTERFDSVVNNVTNPEIFVIFRDAQAYPDYLITFI